VAAYERIIRNEKTRKRFLKNFVALKKLYAVAKHPETIKLNEKKVKVRVYIELPESFRKA